jgi:hypothetical protein
MTRFCTLVNLSRAPNIVGSVFLVCVAFSSDFFGDRALHLATCLMITCVGFIILAAVDVNHNIGVGYFACFLLTLGGYITSPLLATWYNNKYTASSLPTHSPCIHSNI